MNKFSSFYITLGLCLGSFMGLAVFVSNFSPNDVGFLGTTVPLVLVWLCLVSFLRLSLAIINKRDSTTLKIMTFIVPTIVVLTLMFSALGDVNLLEAILLLILATLGNFYLARTWPK